MSVRGVTASHVLAPGSLTGRAEATFGSPRSFLRSRRTPYVTLQRIDADGLRTEFAYVSVEPFTDARSADCHGSRGVSQHALYGFDVRPGRDRQRCRGVPQIVRMMRWNSRVTDSSLESRRFFAR